MSENYIKEIKLPPLDFRIPKWDLNDLQERRCPICNEDKSAIKFIRPDSLTVRLCINCNTFFISPAPSSQQIARFYANYDKNHRREPVIKTNELVKSYQGINALSDFRIKELTNHMDIRNSKVLDVGFGRAQFLFTLMELGATPYGLELDKKAIEYATALGIQNVYEKSIEDMSDENKFDLIVLNDLIEHPLKPISLLKKASDLLESKGLLMIWTPNGEITNKESCPTTFRVDLEHMQYLTPGSCRYIAHQFNLRIVHLQTLGFPNLKDIDKPFKAKPNLKIRIKKIIKSIPGSSIINKLIKKYKSNSSSIKTQEKELGAYHLFCIMQKFG